MAAVDRAAIEEVGLPGLVLMENAALGVVDALVENFPEARTVALLCGPGNNGGDGLAVARQLESRGYRARIYLVGGEGWQPAATSDVGRQASICRNLGLTVTLLPPSGDQAAAVRAAAGADVIVDALFGTGLSRPLEGHFRELVEALDALPVPRLAVDLPSGLNGSRTAVFGPHLRADVTVTFAALKVAHVFEPVSRRCGEVVVTDLGFPPHLVDEVVERWLSAGTAAGSAPGGALHLLTGEELAACLVPREADGHKGDYGHLLLVAGSPGKSGAAVLAARAAVRGGAGLVTAAVPRSLLATVDGGCPEAMTLACPATAAGGLGADAVAAVLAACRGKSAVALGPGLAVTADGGATVQAQEETWEAIRRIALECPLPLVLDADGLNAFAGRGALLRERSAVTVLTPHPGEMARLLGTDSATIQGDRLAAVRRAAEVTGAITVLKGHHTLVATPEGEVHLNRTGNPGMATGGSGDVLTGLVGALLAQGFEALTAAQLGVYLHGLAGDLVAEGTGHGALAAGDLPRALGEARRRLGAG
jgi:NAD(P)H-hydrate epimerase